MWPCRRSSSGFRSTFDSLSPSVVFLPFLLGGCITQPSSLAVSTQPSPAPFSYFRIVNVDDQTLGHPLQGQAGDPLVLTVIRAFPDGATMSLPASASISWTGMPSITALAPGTSRVSSLLGLAAGASGSSPSTNPPAVWLSNPYRRDVQASLPGVLCLLDPGSATRSFEVSCTLTAPDLEGSARATVSVGPAPAPNLTHGQGEFQNLCAPCHGTDGRGSAPSGPGVYTIGGATITYPAPALVGHSAPASSDLLLVMMFGDMGPSGLSLRIPMPNWLQIPDDDTGQLMGAHDWADLVAFLRSQPD